MRTQVTSHLKMADLELEISEICEFLAKREIPDEVIDRFRDEKVMSMTNQTDDTVSLISHEEDDQNNLRGEKFVKKRNRKREIRMILLACIVFGCGITVALILDIYVGEHYSGHAAVVSDVKECADIGLELLKKGGSGVDAAIGTMLCVGVMNPESAGIGGGGFMLISPPGQDAEVVDFREMAPLGASKDMFHGNKSLAQWGGLAVAIPGEIRGCEEAHKKYGKLEWSEVIAPSIKLAKDGFKVTPHTARVLKSFKRNITGTRLWKLLAPKGTFLKEDDWMSNPALAETLQTIADKGANAFYEGQIADSIVSAVKSQNGILTHKDLKAYKTVWRETINSTYSGYKVVTTPLPSGGPVLLSTLNILDGFNLTRKDQGKPLTYHYIIEAFKFAFAQRSLLEDPKFGGEIVKNITELMLNKTYATLIRQRISPNKTFPPEHYGSFLYQPKTHGTSHVSVIGPDGELVSFTSTINMYFGSGIMTDTGIILNDEMADFNIPGADTVSGVGDPKANFVEPGKRPLSSTVPTVVLHQEDHCWFRSALGGSGGIYITPAVAEVLINNLTFSDPLDKAIEGPRVYYDFQTGQVAVEVDRLADANKAKEVVKSLKSKGHNGTEKAGIAEVNALVYHQEQLKAHADSRRGSGQGSAQFDA